MYFLSVDQLSGLFLIFLVHQKENCPVSETGQKHFRQSLIIFYSPFNRETEQNNSETDQDFFSPVSET